MGEETQADTANALECPPTKDLAVRWFIFAGIMFGFGVWTAYEAYVLGKYPAPEEWDINEWAGHVFNHYMVFVVGPLGILGVFMALRHLGRKVVADDKGISYGSTTLAWSDVTELDAEMLKEKGLLVLHYGQDESLKLNSLDFANFKELVALAEQHCPVSSPAAEDA